MVYRIRATLYPIYLYKQIIAFLPYWHCYIYVMYQPSRFSFRSSKIIADIIYRAKYTRIILPLPLRCNGMSLPVPHCKPIPPLTPSPAISAPHPPPPPLFSQVSPSRFPPPLPHAIFPTLLSLPKTFRGSPPPRGAHLLTC